MNPRYLEIAARGFRNLSPDPMFFESGTTLITGENAQGKTTLLEAVAAAGRAWTRPLEAAEESGEMDPGKSHGALAGALLEGFATR